MKKMRIGFYTDTYLPNVDGVVSQVLASKKELERRKHYVHVFTPGTLSEKRANRDKTVSYYTGVKFPLYSQYKLALFPFASIFECKKRNIELIHCHALATMGVASIATAKALRLPLVGTFHTMVPLAMHYVTNNLRYQDFLSAASWKVIEAFYTPFDIVTAPSAVIASLLEQHGVENVKVVSNGIDTQLFNPRVAGGQTKRKLGLKDGEKVFVFVGRMTREKQVDVLLRAFAQLKSDSESAKLVIIGDGPAFSEVKALSRKLGLKNVVFTGNVKHNELSNYLAACDWQVSASNFETQGIGILEGMACGKPCVGANALAIPETVKENYNGLLFKSLDVDDCATKLETALKMNEKKYSSLCKGAALTGKKHSVEITVDKWEKIYNSVL